MQMPKKYNKGKSNNLTGKTSIWKLLARGRFGHFDDLRILKANRRLEERLKTNPNFANEIKDSPKEEPIKIPEIIQPAAQTIIEKVQTEVDDGDLLAYNRRREAERKAELEKIRAAEQRKKEEHQRDVERCKRGLAVRSSYDESKYVYWCDARKPINVGKLGHSQPWKFKSPRKYEYY
jgi:hypothetical protein